MQLNPPVTPTCGCFINHVLSTRKMPPKVYPCDQCLHRKIRCDKTLPRCNRCSDSNLTCTREVIRRRPGRKKGSGTVISRLKTDLRGVLSESHEIIHGRLEDFTPESGTPGQGSSNLERPSIQRLNNDQYFTVPRVPRRISTPYGSPASSAPERPAAIISNLPHLSQDIDQFFSNLYPIWPIIEEASFREWLEHPDQIDHSQACLILSICALSALHIPESSAPPEEPRKRRAQRFIRQCLQLRSNFDYIESATILTVQTSFFLSVAEVELQKVRASWFLLREAIMLAQDLRYYDNSLPQDLNQAERLSIRRTLYVLSLTERGLTLLRNKPFAIVMFDSPPEERFADEDPRILVGLQSLSKLFYLLDKQFLDTWMIGSAGSAVPETKAQILNAQHTLAHLRFDVDNLTDIQKADILIAQQWLRLVFWQLSMRQGLLSSASEDPTLSYQFPCVIAQSLCIALAMISMAAVHIHGMAIFERTFEITYSFIDSLCLSRSLDSGLEELRVLFRVLRESPNSHDTYIRILEKKLIEQAGEDGHGIIPQIYQTSLGSASVNEVLISNHDAETLISG